MWRANLSLGLGPKLKLGARRNSLLSVRCSDLLDSRPSTRGGIMKSLLHYICSRPRVLVILEDRKLVNGLPRSEFVFPCSVRDATHSIIDRLQDFR
jgi:hypothetical protein